MTSRPLPFTKSLALGLFGLLTIAQLGCEMDSDDQEAVETMRSEGITPPLLGKWTFEPGSELVDATGQWGNLSLFGNASVSGGQLHVHGSGTNASGWAAARGFSGSLIREKTLVSWVAVDNLDVRAGSALTIDNISGDNFDAIVYAERVAYRWMAGSSYFVRTKDVVQVNEAAVGQMVQMAISYRDLGGGTVQITICRDGVQLAQYKSGSMAQWTGANAEVIFGKRHTDGNYQPGALEGRIEEARIYGGAMTCAEVGGLVQWHDSDHDGVSDDEDVCDGFDDHIDADQDGIPDGCDVCTGDDTSGDDDHDGVCNNQDLCLGDDLSGDLDSDGVCDSIDNCVSVANPDQADANQDGKGDACDDDDEDGVLDFEDNCPAVANADQADSDLDGAGDLCDDDDDDDGVLDGSDNCPL
ncbi:MAG: thrombospondin type 3 repeat-containing protein, partial [Myxococcales bacterium]|nr:thrombospondin type 3 repeat-containing protein [Myxococcales bacterium]